MLDMKKIYFIAFLLLPSIGYPICRTADLAGIYGAVVGGLISKEYSTCLFGVTNKGLVNYKGECTSVYGVKYQIVDMDISINTSCAVKAKITFNTGVYASVFGWMNTTKNMINGVFYTSFIGQNIAIDNGTFSATK